MDFKAKYLLMVTVISLSLTIFLYIRSNLNNAPQAFNLIIQIDGNFSMNDYFAMKYSLRPHPQRLMNMSLTVAESGALALRLTQAMQKHGVDVDIYGACGQLRCQKIPGNSDCFKMLEKDYKFYLSFENSLCNHYVSEKFTNILRYNIVPVTYGLGHELLGVPKDAYIDVFDYPDVASLAKHLLYLASNDSAYNEYFRWKKHLRVTGYSGGEHPFCKLCADLHADPPLLQRKYDLQAWFSDGQCIDVTKNPRLQNFLGIANGQTGQCDEIGLIKLLALVSMYHLLTYALNIGAKLCETMIP